MSAASAAQPLTPEPLGPEQAEALAKQYGLRKMGVRPPLGQYIRSVWARRQFIGVLARSKAYAENQNTYLGQFWAVLNPLMNALVYLLIFGILLRTTRGMENPIGFIVVGVFIFRFFGDSLTQGAKSIPKNRGLVRSLQFPRAVLPLSAVLAQLTTLLPAVLVMAIITWGSGLFLAHVDAGPNWRWLLLVLALPLIYLFSTGCGFIMARICSAVPDVLNLIPFGLRILMYASGVLFSIDHYVGNVTAKLILEHQPVGIYLNLARQAMLQEPSIPLDYTKWLWGLGWAVLFFIVGFVIFWRDEARYGRE